MKRFKSHKGAGAKRSAYERSRVGGRHHRKADALDRLVGGRQSDRGGFRG